MFAKASEMLEMEKLTEESSEENLTKITKALEPRREKPKTLSGLKNLKKRKKEPKPEPLSQSEQNLMEKYLTKVLFVLFKLFFKSNFCKICLFLKLLLKFSPGVYNHKI